jgi:O-antigen ligase
MSARFAILLIFTFLLPVIFWPRSTSYEASKLTLMAVTAALLIAIYALRVRQRKALAFRMNWLGGAGLVVLGVGLATLPWAVNPVLALQAVLLLGAWLVLAGSYSVEITARRHLVMFITAVTLGCVLAATYGLLQMARVLPGALDAASRPGISSLGNQNYLAGLLAVICFPSLLLWGASGRRARMLAAAASMFLFAATWLSSALGPILALITVAVPLTGALLLVSRGRGRLVPRWYELCLALGLGAAVIGGILALQVPTRQLDGSRRQPNPVRRLYNSNSGDIRLTDWAVGVNMVRERPLTGVGWNNYKVAWPRYRAQLVRQPDGPDWAAHAPRATKAHNEYVQFVAESGVAGGLILLVGSVVVLIHFRRRFMQLSEMRQQLDFLFLLAGVSVAALHAVVSFPFHLPATAGLLALLIGALESRYFTAPASDPTPVMREISIRWHPAASAVLVLLAVILAAGAVREFRADLQQRRGIAAFRTGNYRAARDLLTRATTSRLWPGDGLFYLAMSRRAVGSDVQRGVRMRSGNTMEEMSGHKQPSERHNANDTSDVMTPLRTSLRHEPTFEAYLHLAEELRDQRRFTEALEYLTLVDRCEPTERLRRESWYLRATIALRQNDYERARTLLDGLLATAPAYHRAWIASGYLAALTADTQTAAQHYQRALDVIDRKIQDLDSQPPAAVAGPLNRLQQQRAVAQRALASLVTEGK